MLRIGLVQMRCEKGAISGNLESMSHYVAEAAARNVDILAFPEMSVTGYAVPSKYASAKLRLDGPETGRLLGMTRAFPGIVLAGLIEENPAGKPFITQVVAKGGRLLGHYRKRTIVDDEAGWFSAGSGAPVFQYGGVVFAIAICADIGNEAVFAECSQKGARIMFELAAPGLYGRQDTRNWRSGYEWWKGECDKHLGAYARKYGLWIGVATQAGRTVDEDFPGGGYLYAPGGEKVCETMDWSPGALYLSLDLEKGWARKLE